MNGLSAMWRNKTWFFLEGDKGAGAGVPPAETPPVESLINTPAAVDAAPEGETPEGEPAAVAPEGEPAPEAPAPLTAESVVLPEGFSADPEDISAFVELVNDADLTPVERANKLIELQASVLTKANSAAEEAANALWTETQEQWQQAARALPEIGGANLPVTLGAIKKGLEAAGATAETFAAFDLTGAGNHPEIIRVLSKLTKPFVEGGPIQGTQTRGPLSQAERLFPNQNPE